MTLALIGLLGAAGTAASYFAAGPGRFWTNWIIWTLYLGGIGIGALFVVGLEHLVGAKWSVPLRRSAERVAGLLVPASAAGLLALFALPHLYPWTRPEAAANPILAGKAAWLNVPFFCVRTALCYGLWLLAYRFYAGGSLEQDQARGVGFTLRARRFAPAFMAMFALTVTVVAFDWISSLTPEWYSDIFGVYLFAGIFLAGLAGTAVLALRLVRAGRLPGVRSDHFYNLGGFLFAFTVFWSYIAFAQYMLIWYGNLPDEIVWYQQRIDGPWRPVILALAFFHFVVPFFALVPRDSKGEPRRLFAVSCVVLASHWLDLYWLIYPSLGIGPRFSWPELSFAALFLCGGLACVRRRMSVGNDMPVGDPLLQQGLAFRL